LSRTNCLVGMALYTPIWTTRQRGMMH